MDAILYTVEVGYDVDMVEETFFRSFDKDEAMSIYKTLCGNSGFKTIQINEKECEIRVFDSKTLEQTINI